MVVAAARDRLAWGKLATTLPILTYLCQWAPATCPGFLFVTFGTVGALTSFEFSESGPPPLNTRRAVQSETQEFPPRCRHAHSFRNLSWNSASRPPLFLPTILLQKFMQVFDTSKIPVHCLSWPGYSEKRWFAWPVRTHLFFCYAIFTWIWTYKTHDLPDYQLTIGSFLQAITFMWSYRQIPEWP